MTKNKGAFSKYLWKSEGFLNCKHVSYLTLLPSVSVGTSCTCSLQHYMIALLDISSNLRDEKNGTSSCSKLASLRLLKMDIFSLCEFEGYFFFYEWYDHISGLFFSLSPDDFLPLLLQRVYCQPLILSLENINHPVLSV